MSDCDDMKTALKEVQLRYWKGSNNHCPRCYRSGNFGSIVRYMNEDGNDYLICGWCGSITKIGRRIEGDER